MTVEERDSLKRMLLPARRTAAFGILLALLVGAAFVFGRAEGIREERQRQRHRLRALRTDLEEVRTAAYALGTQIDRFVVDEWELVVPDVQAGAFLLKSAVDSLENREGWLR